ncbi:SDR family oxidoreductase [Micromonospora sp. CPCC 205558]|uniref:SDR family oxidoreductase n=1 Tax=Micromonospora sp. CPCC 205558 TaxID=3122403 RepID=UPI002FF37530
MSEDQHTQQDPTTQYGGQSGQPAQQQSAPGSTGEMTPRPDHGEESYRGSGKLDGKRALITGGDSGIGRAVAIAFAREGADVLISYLGEEEDADARETIRLVEAAGRRGIAVRGDITDEEHCQELVDRAVRDLGGLDILVNNAAYQMSQDKGILGISTEQFDRVFKTNLYAMFWLCKAAIPHLAEGSAIINTSSIQAFDPSPQLLDYATTKAGIANFTKALAADLAEQGIRVNAVAPGPVWTPLIPATMPEEKVKQFGTDTPQGRPGQPAELAPAYVFFASQESSYVTGEILGVTGGRPTK